MKLNRSSHQFLDKGRTDAFGSSNNFSDNFVSSLNRRLMARCKSARTRNGNLRSEIVTFSMKTGWKCEVNSDTTDLLSLLSLAGFFKNRIAKKTIPPPINSPTSSQPRYSIVSLWWSLHWPNSGLGNSLLASVVDIEFSIYTTLFRIDRFERRFDRIQRCAVNYLAWVCWHNPSWQAKRSEV